MKIRKGDRVQVLTGKDRGKTGTVTRSIPARGRVIVDGVNIAKKHQKPTSATQQGGIIDKEMPIHVSNVAVWNPVTQKADRVGIRVLEDGRKVRFYKSNGELINA
jgi:large subunit ribosomal protein L24